MRRDQLRESIRKAKYLEEDPAVTYLLEHAAYDLATAGYIEASAAELVTAVRDTQRSKPLLDTFLSEYGLSNSEGVALMCLAESLLRVPDWDTADLLIADKLGSGDWSGHAGHAHSLLVNASTWALMLTGRIVEMDDHLTDTPAGWLKKLVARISEPVVQAAVRRAMAILGGEFVLGQTIETALQRCNPGQPYSFDMLGEAARDMPTAERYFANYMHAINAAGRSAQRATSSISIKLSALHPRYQASQRQRVMQELLPRLAELSAAADKAGLWLTIDAEEAARLDLSLDVFECLLEDHRVGNIGMVVQAYAKRAPRVLDWLIKIARDNNCIVPIRLVKGAYWDTEIKQAQVDGMAGFPVYTRKASTDLSYLVCAKKILDHPQELSGQFATHNAHTVAAVLQLGRDRSFEFQRLHGMGENLYASAAELFDNFPLVRTYAPVGAHQDLLAYLVRRLLENGANSSFVNRFLDESVSPTELVRDPLRVVSAREHHHHPGIRLPAALFDERSNSSGIDYSETYALAQIESAISLPLQPRTDPDEPANDNTRGITTPYNRHVTIGHIEQTSTDRIDEMVRQAATAQRAWDATHVEVRKKYLLRCARQIEEARTELIGLLVHEAGKTIPDAISEVREAVDFCRYYANEAERLFSHAVALPGPTGEENTLSLHGRGVWVSISPWNFPLAIFLGQVSAALAAGNAVIAKPSEATPLIAQRCIDILHQANVPAEVCQLAAGGAEIGQALVEHPQIAGVAFTGSTRIAHQINLTLATTRARQNAPIVPLIAETGGQNAMIVDSTALLEQVTDDVIQSAFMSAGQRCSALRVLFLQDEIADQALTMLIGAMNELNIGDPGKATTDIGPVISASAAASLHNHIEDMRARGWLRHQLSPDAACRQGYFVAPALVEIPDIQVLQQEHFGPILHVIRFTAGDIPSIIDEINHSGFGLTSGIHTRIAARARYLASQVDAGNIYVNRNMIGAVVGSQPFGGQGLSGTGPKAGGPNYLMRFATEKVVTINSAATGGNPDLLSL